MVARGRDELVMCEWQLTKLIEMARDQRVITALLPTAHAPIAAILAPDQSAARMLVSPVMPIYCLSRSMSADFIPTAL